MPNTASSVPGKTATHEPSSTQAKQIAPRSVKPRSETGTRKGRTTSGYMRRSRTAAGITSR